MVPVRYGGRFYSPGAVCSRLALVALIRPPRCAGVSYLVLAEQPQVVERDRQHFVAVIIALENLGRSALVLVECLFLGLLSIELGPAGEELLLIERNLFLRFLFFVQLDFLLALGEFGRTVDPFDRVLL